MAIAVEETVTGSTTSAESFNLTSWTPQAGEFVLVYVAQRNELISIGVSGNNLSWTELQNCDNTQGQCGIAVWKGEGGSPTTGQITVTITGNSLPVIATAHRISGIHSTPVDNSAQEPGPDDPPGDNDDMIISITTGVTNAYIIAGGTHRGQIFTTPGTEDEISINNSVGTSGDTTTLSIWGEQATTTGSYQLGDLNDLSAIVDWACVAVSIAPEAGIQINVHD